MKKILVLITLFVGLSSNAYVTHEHNEYSYQKAWAEKHNAIIEYKLDDYTRVDCLTPTHAIEFDFYNKWAEAVGQALYYSLKTGKKPMVILILENPQKQMIYFNRVKQLANAYNFEVQYVTKDILNLDPQGKCSNPKCKCHK